MDENEITALREYLLDKDGFLELSKMFVDRAVKEYHENDPDFCKWLSLAFNSLIETNIEIIFAQCESPIEKIFINSLLLAFLRYGSPGLIIHSFYHDAEEELSAFRTYYNHFQYFLGWYDKNFESWTDIESYLDNELATGKMDENERNFLRMMTFRYHYLMMKSDFHLTLQAKFPNIVVDGSSIRPDLFFWLPSDENVKIIVECDGFEIHSKKKTFISDRKRDRILQAKGFQVLRYSGSEIYHEPIKVSREIIEFLTEIKEDISRTD
jgi:hypothetical protein